MLKFGGPGALEFLKFWGLRAQNGGALFSHDTGVRPPSIIGSSPREAGSYRPFHSGSGGYHRLSVDKNWSSEHSCVLVLKQRACKVVSRIQHISAKLHQCTDMLL